MALLTDIFELIKIQSLTVPATKTDTVTSSVCDVSGYTGAAFYIHYGASGDTLSGTVYWTGKLQECATEDGTFTDVAASDVSGASTNAFGLVNASGEDSAVYGLKYIGTLDYVKVVVTATGTHTNGTPIGVFAGLGMPRAKASDQEVNP